MRKTGFILVLVALAMVLGSQAWAKKPKSEAGTPAQATSQQREQFLKETETLRQSVWDKQSRLNELLSKPESDPAQIGTLEKEIYQIREQIRAKAQEAGFNCPHGGNLCGMGFGMGRGGCGMGMGYGMRK